MNDVMVDPALLNHTHIPALGSHAHMCCMEELHYLEFFAGRGEVFTAVRADHAAAAVDLEYMDGKGHAMDINSQSGLPFHPLHLFLYIYRLHHLLCFIDLTI